MERQSTIPEPAELVARARALIPDLARRAAWGDRNRRLPDETIADLRAAGFFRVLQPRRWGGFEMSPGTFFQIQAALAEGDVSPAWVYGVVGLHPWLLALLDDRAARDVWAEDDATLICSPLIPAGKAQPVDGGFRLHGRWKYSSGCDHCRWAFLGGLVAATDGGSPEWRLFLVPRGDFTVVDTWDVAGLRGTGSNDVVVEDAFVPGYRTQLMVDNFNCRGPGQAVNSSPLYRMPFGQIFFRGISTGAIGALQGMLSAFLAYGGGRVTTMGSRTAEDPVAQLVVAEAASAVDQMTAILQRNFDRLAAYAAASEMPPLAERLHYRFQSAEAAERCGALALRLFKATGGAGLAVEHPFSRFLADINGARQHVANQFETIGRNWGAVMLGLEAKRDLML